MTVRKSKLQRTVDYFRTADWDEARVTFELVKEVMDERQATLPQAVPKRKRRHSKAANGPEPPQHEAVAHS